MKFKKDDYIIYEFYDTGSYNNATILALAIDEEHVKDLKIISGSCSLDLKYSIKRSQNSKIIHNLGSTYIDVNSFEEKYPEYFI
ncbi:MAG: hypothetical protein BV457_05870 [Thermoplasmata archaeon M9B1D]|nr:MAG: hypothetical protein BV457_05870 [Thermoplasmata archaeon M9B1D]PNX51236.1 MAG: hypothetical protein BV456_04015 [Thermoplasmata archaeon M8B2D]